jgi:ABC-type phosphate transport system substrate-binding protein
VRNTIKKRTGLAAAGAIALSVSLLGPAAHADYAPSSTDVVGVGGDTPQYDVDFGLDGDVNGNLGYNAANNVNKAVSIDATADSNGRTGYLNGSSLAAAKNLNPTVVLRSGTNPVQRPQSTTAGIAAINADTGAIHQIDFVRVGRLPTAAEQAKAALNGWGYLHVVELGTDTLDVAVNSPTTNAPAGLSAQELVSIYSGSVTKWNQLPGNAAGSGNTIIPLIPPTTSVINTTFLAALKAANGGVAVTLASSVQTVEQNDPAAITGLGASAADAIVPFSQARLNLWNSAYFHDPTVVFPGGAALVPHIQLLNGTPGDANPDYSSALVHYVIFRNSDASDAPWQPGSTKNWVQALFSDSAGTPFFKKSSGQALVASAGITPLYSDLGNVSAG